MIDQDLDISGRYCNFLQYWKQQTEEEIHRDNSGDTHDHINVYLSPLTDDTFKMDVYRGRLDPILIAEEKLVLSLSGNTWSSEDGNIRVNADGLFIDQLEGLSRQKSPYELFKCRQFSGFIEYRLPGQEDEYYRMGNLELYDQGDLVQLDYPGATRTVELTQLVFAHRIPLMKVAIYDLPKEQVAINSKAISYAWASPDAKRIGINTREIVTGWTFIEEGFLSSNNMDLDQD